MTSTQEKLNGTIDQLRTHNEELVQKIAEMREINEKQQAKIDHLYDRLQGQQSELDTAKGELRATERQLHTEREMVLSLGRSLSYVNAREELRAKGYRSHMGALRAMLGRVEKQRDEAYRELDRLHTKKVSTELSHVPTNDSTFEAHLDGLYCGNLACTQCHEPTPPQGE